MAAAFASFTAFGLGFAQIPLAIAAPPSASTDIAPKTAILPLVVEGELPDTDREALTNQLVEGLQRGSFEVVTPDQVVAAAGDKDCDKPACMTKIAEQTGATHIVRAVVQVVDRDYTVSVGLYDGKDGTKVLFGIRPEDLQLSSEGDGLPMTVEVVEFTGREVELFGARDDERICVLVRERTGLKPDETVWLKPNVERAHVFDADSGRSLYVN